MKMKLVRVVKSDALDMGKPRKTDKKVARKSDDGTDFTDVANQLRKMLTSSKLVRAMAEGIYYENSVKLKRLLEEFLSSGNRLTKELLAYR